MTIGLHGRLRAIFLNASIVLLPLWGCGPPVANTDTGILPVPGTPDSIASALRHINARIVQDPDRPELYVQRAVHFGALDSVAPAIRDMERAVRLDSTNVTYRLMLGDLYYRIVEVDQAMASFTKASQIDPSNTQALLKRAEIHLVLRKYNESMALVNEALRKDPNVAHGYYLKGWIHMEVRDTALALSSLRTAVEQDPNDYRSYLLLGSLSAARKDPLAVQYYSTAVNLRPNSVEALYALGLAYQESGRDSLALAIYDRIKELDHANALPWYNSGYIHMEHRNDDARARIEFSKAIELEPQYADAWYNRGVIMERATELDSAAANYQMAILIQPQHQLAAEGLDRLAGQGVRIKIREQRDRK
ncbi:MAG TPA: tetratricopeptide repeat protein [Flavobacteriales bacterium]